MSDFLKEHLERRRADTHAQSESSETAELLQSLNSNIGLVANSTAEGGKTSRQILGAVQSQIAIEKQRDTVYAQYTKEQLGAFYDFSDYQRSQTKTLSKHLREMNTLLKDIVGAKLDASEKTLGEIAKYLKPDLTRSKRQDDAMLVARKKGLRDKKGTSEKKNGPSLVDDVFDLFDDDTPDRRRRKGKSKRTRKPMGQPSSPSRSSSKPSWWDRIRSKTGNAGGVADDAYDLMDDDGTPDRKSKGKPGKGGAKGLWNKIPKGVKVGGLLSAALAAPALYDTLTSDDPNVDKTKEVTKTAGSVAGGAGGWAAGAAAGGAMGALAGPAAPITVPLGALAGGLLGAWGGSEAGEYLADKGTDATRAAGSAIGKAYDGTVDATSRGIENVANVGQSIANGFKTSVLPGFNHVVGNFGKFADDFEVSTVSMISGLSKSLSEIGDDLKGGAQAVWSGAKQVASRVATGAGDYADRAVKKVTGDKNATLGSVASSAKDKALNVLGLGGTSAQFESGKMGTKAVGWDPTGGTSYGKYQIAAKTGTAKEFLDFVKQRGGNDDIHQQLSEAGFEKDTGSKRGAAVDAWQKLASSQGSSERLSELEHKFIEQKKFMPAYSKAKELGFNTDDKGVQDAIWSAAVQHGKVNSEILGKVAGKGDLSKMSTEDQIKAIYNRRSEYVDGLKNVSQSAGRDRYEKEVKVALAKSAGGKNPEVAATKAPIGSVAVSSVLGEQAASAQATPAVNATKQSISVAAQKVAPVVAARKEPQRMVDQSTPAEAQPVQVANAEQIRGPAPKAAAAPAAQESSGGGMAALPTLDSIPLQITDMGLVLLNIGHI